MAATIFKPNPAFERELLADQDTHAALIAFAERALEGAQAAAPFLTGRYRDSLELDISGNEVSLISTSSFWALIEFGSVNNPPFAPLQRGVESAGLHFRDDGAR